jgi:hypothetical protein
MNSKASPFSQYRSMNISRNSTYQWKDDVLASRNYSARVNSLGAAWRWQALSLVRHGLVRIRVYYSPGGIRNVGLYGGFILKPAGIACRRSRGKTKAIRLSHFSANSAKAAEGGGQRCWRRMGLGACLRLISALVACLAGWGLQAWNSNLS